MSAITAITRCVDLLIPVMALALILARGRSGTAQIGWIRSTV
jgi:hypothetical protein